LLVAATLRLMAVSSTQGMQHPALPVLQAVWPLLSQIMQSPAWLADQPTVAAMCQVTTSPVRPCFLCYHLRWVALVCCLTFPPPSSRLREGHADQAGRINDHAYHPFFMISALPSSCDLFLAFLSSPCLLLAISCAFFSISPLPFTRESHCLLYCCAQAGRAQRLECRSRTARPGPNRQLAPANAEVCSVIS
jgi:hypothetical protein